MLFWLAVIVILDEIVLWRRSVEEKRQARALPPRRHRYRPTTLTIDLRNRL